jgi:hypothetical protein
MNLHQQAYQSHIQLGNEALLQGGALNQFVLYPEQGQEFPKREWSKASNIFSSLFGIRKIL